MKLYYAAGACSLVPHILLCELGKPFDLEKVNLQKHETESGIDYYAINFKGSVPMIEHDNGERLTENIAIVQYLADQDPAKNLLPKTGTMARYQAIEMFSFIGDVHKCYGALFHADRMSDLGKENSNNQLLKFYSYLDNYLKDKEYLIGHHFGAPDAYLFVTLRWGYALRLPIDNLSHLKAFFERVKLRPAVQDALRSENLLK